MIGFGTFVVVIVLGVCAVTGVFHPLFGLAVFGGLFVVLAGMLAVAVRTPPRWGRR